MGRGSESESERAISAMGGAAVLDYVSSHFASGSEGTVRPRPCAVPRLALPFRYKAYARCSYGPRRLHPSDDRWDDDGRNEPLSILTPLEALGGRYAQV